MPPHESQLSTESISQNEDGCFTESKPDALYTVDNVRGICTCYDGSSAKLCKHLSTVVQKLDSSCFHRRGLKIANKQSRKLMYVATGCKPRASYNNCQPPKFNNCLTYRYESCADTPANINRHVAVHVSISLEI